MPTICRITLDAAEYKRELDEVVAQSRAAQTALEKPVSVPVEPPKPVEVEVIPPEPVVVPVEQPNPVEVEVIPPEPVVVPVEQPEIHTVSDAPEVAQAAQETLNGIKDKEVAVKVTTTQTERTSPEVTGGPAAQKSNQGQIAGAANGIKSAGEQITKAGGAVNAFSSALGTVSPQLGMIGQSISALVSGPIGLLSVAIGLLVTIGMDLWNKLTLSAAEYASKLEKNAAAAEKELAKENERQAAAKQYIDRIGELNNAEQSGKIVKEETATLLDILSSKYGDLGAQIDATTGRILNLEEVEDRINQKRKGAMNTAMSKDIGAATASADAQYRVFQKTQPGNSGQYKNEMDGLKALSAEDQVKYFRRKLSGANTQEQIDAYQKQIDMRSQIAEKTKQQKLYNQTGYKTEEERDAALSKQAAKVNAKQAANAEQKKNFEERKTNDEFTDVKTPSEKIANREKLINAELERRKKIEEDLKKAQLNLANAQKDTAVTDPKKEEKILAAKERQAQLESELQGSSEKVYGLNLEIARIKDQQAEAYKKLTDQAAYELEYNKLIAAGEFEKAAALKLEKDLKDQNLKLTDEQKQKLLEQGEALKKLDTAKQIADAKDEVALQTLLVAGKYEEYEAEKLRIEAKRQGKNLTEQETKALLEQRKLLGAQNLRKSLKDQAYGVYGQAMEKAGRGREFAEEKALKDARGRKGRDLDPDEIANVKKITDLSWKFENQKDIQLGDTSVKTNSLTARGGFAGGAKLPDTEKINREISNYNKQQVEILTRIKEYLDQLENS